MTHNHPSGDPTPSQADIELTKQLRDALALVDVRVLDHIVVGMEGCESFAEKGFI
ncbi:DNA repair protein RadC [Paenalcaligenes hominis]|uniref:DNA repair protein RadC n=1 Tax=Paenalcaligenes hominis TaxID=643674 RepID=A0ABX0WP21_9BURK|nr:DNA repair protein RadC [Paenalcaligenes hominis]